jgi:DMSO reductase anchor subunit
MIRREPQLVFFTVFSQLSAGLVVVWGLVATLESHPEPFLAAGFLRLVLSIALLVLVLGVMAASLHLGSPGRSPLALTNFKHSWLSREALAGLVFGSLVVVLLLISWAGVHPSFSRFLVVFPSLAGLGLVWSIARLYRLRTVPAWNHPGTPATFFTTSLLLGTAALRVLYCWFWGQDLSPGGWSITLDWVLVGLVSLQFLTSLSSFVYLSTRGEKAVDSLRLVWSSLRLLLISRWVLAFGSLGVLFALNRDGAIYWRNPFGAVLLVFTLLLGSEVIGRWIFYSSYRREGI